MDTCNWLLDAGVDADHIEWIRSRDPWLFDRAYMQPLDRVGAYMQLQARWVKAAADAEDAIAFAHQLEDNGVLLRIDGGVEPDAFRGATISATEVDALRSIERVVRKGRVRRIATNEIAMEDGDVATDAGRVYVDCTAAGVRPTKLRPIFEPDRIILQYVTVGIVPWSAATTGVVEASRDTDAQKNALCPPLVFTGNSSDLLTLAHSSITGMMARGSEPDLAAWSERCRLNPARGAADHMDDPRVPDAFATLAKNIGPAMANLERRAGAAVTVPV
jgi:hypothetical protein